MKMQQFLESYFFKAKTTNMHIHTLIQFLKNKFFRRKGVERAQKITILNFNIRLTE